MRQPNKAPLKGARFNRELKMDLSPAKEEEISAFEPKNIKKEDDLLKFDS